MFVVLFFVFLSAFGGGRPSRSTMAPGDLPGDPDSGMATIENSTNALIVMNNIMNAGIGGKGTIDGNGVATRMGESDN